MKTCPARANCAEVRSIRDWRFDWSDEEECERIKTHFDTYSHDDLMIPCRRGEECTRYRRLPWVKLVEPKQKIEAEFHCLVYTHKLREPAARKIVFKYVPRVFSGKDPRRSLEDEVKLNLPLDQYVKLFPEFPSQFKFSHEQYAKTMMAIAQAKLNHPRHRRLGTPLDVDEMLSILLYTGTKIIDDFRASTLRGDFHRWQKMRDTINRAIRKLHDAEMEENPEKNKTPVYAGFRDVIVDADRLDALFRASSRVKELCEGYEKPQIFLPYNDVLSSSIQKEVAESPRFCGEKGFMFVIERHSTAICADVSWISKFPDEKEILFAPSTLAIRRAIVKPDTKRTELEVLIMNASLIPMNRNGDIIINVPMHAKPQKQAQAIGAGAGAPNRIACIAVNPKTSILDLKWQIYRDTTVLPGKQALRFLSGNKKVLKNHATIGSLGIAATDDELKRTLCPSSLGYEVPPTWVAKQKEWLNQMLNCIYIV